MESEGFPCVICGKVAAKSDSRCASCGHSFAGELRSRYELGEGPFSKDEKRIKRYLIALLLFDFAFLPAMAIGLGAFLPRDELFHGMAGLGAVTSLMTTMFTLTGVEVRARWARWSSLILFGHTTLGTAGLTVAFLVQGRPIGAIVCLFFAILWALPLASSWRLVREISTPPI